MRSNSVYQFQEYTVDIAARAIRRGGSVVEIEAKVFDLIALLIENRQRALSKREINDALWGQRPVTDAALSQLLSKARRALGDDGDRQKVIRTVHGRGLQWAAELDHEDQVPESASVESTRVPRATRALWLAAFAATVAIAIAFLIPQLPPSANDDNPLPRIAVLPINDSTGEPDLGWTRNGLMGLIGSLLQEQGRVEVISSQIVQDVVGKRDSDNPNQLNALRESLGATHLVRAELRRIGTLYELELQLSSAGRPDRRDILRGSAPTPLAVDAVPRIQHWLGLIPLASAAEDGSDIRNPFLAEAYARGLDASAHGDESGAMKYFQICLDQDPGLLWPRLRLASAQGITNQQDASIENATRVADVARKSGQDDLLVQALRQLSATAYFKGDGDAAAGYLDEALGKLPDDSRPLALASVHSTYGAVEIKRGNLDAARAHLNRALPLTRSTGNKRNETSVLVNLAIIDVERGQFDDSFVLFRQAIDSARQCGAKNLEIRALGGLGAAEYDSGQALMAIPMLSQAVTLAQELADMQTTVHVATNLARMLADFGRYESADTLIQRALEIGQQHGNTAWQAKAWWARGIVAEQRGDFSEAGDALDKAHHLFALTRSNLDDAAVLADMTRVGVRAGNAELAERAASTLAALVEANPGAPKLALMIPVVEAQAEYAKGNVAESMAALQKLIDDNVSGLDWPPRYDVLLQLGRWRLEQHDPGAALSLMSALAPWREQQPNAIELYIAALQGAGKNNEASAERIRLEGLKSSPDLDIDVDLLLPAAAPDNSIPSP
ncbi:MAG: tetratricopeptide repeat protein [Xanthomonadales bacterium]|nr:tetratricopeptide repeat protein [Xanthomonadales bacterium]